MTRSRSDAQASHDPVPVNRYGAITDVPGVRVGSAERIGEGWFDVESA